MDNTICISGFVMGLICAFISGNISSSKGRSYGEGFAIGLLLGIIGLIIVAVLPKNEEGLGQRMLENGIGRKCPHCAEIIKNQAVVCRYCGKDLPEESYEEEIDADDDSEGNESSDPSSNDNPLEMIIEKIDRMILKKPAEEYLKHGMELLNKNEFNDALIEFAKVIRKSSPKEKSYKSATKILKEMGFSESDIRKI